MTLPPAPSSPPTPGSSSGSGSSNRSFGRFQLLLEMARGGMATIYLARLRGPQKFEKLVVVKRIHEHQAQDAQFIKMFLDEARIAARIEHPNVATVFDLGENEGAYFLAMEYVHGHNVAEIVKSAYRHPGVLHWSHAVRMVADAAAGLHGAHEAKGADGRALGIVHRDVSPQNILISYDGHVKVVDFGIAFAAERLTHTAAGTVKGKAAYMSPEQVCMEPLDRRSDVFSLGIVLFEATCRRRLFKEPMEAATILRVRDAKVPRPRSVNPELPAGLERVMLKALAKRPEDRFQTAGALEEALDQVLHDTGHPVSHRELSSLMQTLFHDVRKLRDRQIRDALEQREEPGPMRAMGVGGSASSSTTEMPGSTVLQRPARVLQRRLVIPVVAALAALGSLAVAIGLLAPRCGEPADSGKAATSRSQASKGGGGPGSGTDAGWASGADAGPASGAKPRKEPAAGTPEVRRLGDAARSGSALRTRKTAGPRDGAIPATRRVTLRIAIHPRRAKPVVRFRGQYFWGSDFRIQVPPSARSEVVEIQAPGYQAVREQVSLSEDVRRTVWLQRTPTQAGRGSTSPMVRRRRRGSRREPVFMRPRRRSAADLTKSLPED